MPEAMKLLRLVSHRISDLFHQCNPITPNQTNIHADFPIRFSIVTYNGCASTKYNTRCRSINCSQDGAESGNTIEDVNLRSSGEDKQIQLGLTFGLCTVSINEAHRFLVKKAG